MKTIFWLGPVLGAAVVSAVIWRAPGRPIHPTAPRITVAESRSSAPAPSHSATTVLYHHPEQLPPWCIAYGKEFWKHASASASEASRGKPVPAALAPPFDLAEVIDRVSHAFSPDPTGSNLTARARSYTARIEGGAIHL